jgi:tol-pal system protein YbgF
MRQWLLKRYLVLAVLALLAVAACEATYTYLPGRSQSSPPLVTGAAEAPAGAPAPAPAAPDLAQQVRALEARVQQLEGRVAQLEGRKAPAAAREKPVLTPSVASYPKAPAAGSGGKTYTEGMRLYHAKKYGEARSKFSQYLKSQPNGPKAAEARYYLADSFYLEVKYKEAAVEFNKLVTLYPQSILAPASLLRQALSYKNLQQTANYQSTMKKLLKAYPNSPEAKEAQRWQKEEKKAPEKKGPEKKAAER